MLKALVSLECKKILGINQFLNSKNQKNIHRHRGMNLLAYLIVIVVMSVMIVNQVIGLSMMGLGKIIPEILVMAGSVLIFLLSVFGTGDRIFSTKGLSMLRTMPIKGGMIALSRLVACYIENLILGLTILLPSVIVYGVIAEKSFCFYLIMILGIVALPCIPVAVAALLGMGIVALSSKSRHPVGMRTVLSILLMVIVPGASLLVNPMSKLSSDVEVLSQQLEKFMEEAIFYPPAKWLGHAANGEIFGLLIFLIVSIATFAVVAWILCKSFDKICLRLSNTGTRRGYKGKELRKGSILKTLYFKEWKRYVSSSIYVSNTIIAPILAFAAAVAVNFVNLGKVEEVLPVQLSVVTPILWTTIASLMTSCAVSVTMEGKEIWRVKTLPIPVKTWLDSKLLLGLSLMLPSYVLSEIAMVFAFRPSMTELLWQLMMPLVLMMFTCNFAIGADLRFHNFDFERDEIAVKQSISSMTGGLGGVLFSLIVCGLVILSKGRIAVRIGILVVVLLLTGVIYDRNSKVKMAEL